MLPSSNPQFLQRAASIANQFTRQYMRDGIVGIVLQGAIPRSYFDHHADIDVAIFKSASAEVLLGDKFFKIEGIEVHVWLSNYEDELTEKWDMAKRWTYTNGRSSSTPGGRSLNCSRRKSR